MDKALMLNKIQEHYGFRTASEFADFLGIKPQVLSNWKARNTFDSELLYTKCLEINPEWLLTGRMPMLKKDLNGILSEASLVPTKGEVLQNKNGNKITVTEDGRYFITTPLVPFKVYAGKIDEYQQAVLTQAFEDEAIFSADHFAMGNYMSFEISGYSMDNGKRDDTPDGALVLGRELTKGHWKDGFNEAKYGWIIISKMGMVFKDIVGYNHGTAEITLHSRNTSPEFTNFQMCLNDVFQIFKVVKRSF